MFKITKNLESVCSWTFTKILDHVCNSALIRAHSNIFSSIRKKRRSMDHLNPSGRFETVHFRLKSRGRGSSDSTGTGLAGRWTMIGWGWLMSKLISFNFNNWKIRVNFENVLIQLIREILSVFSSPHSHSSYSEPSPYRRIKVCHILYGETQWKLWKST